MKLLAFETSSREGSVALHVDGAVRQALIDTPRKQTEELLPLATKLLDSAGLSLRELDAIAFGRGPGSFTGLRIAASAAQGLGMATGLPLLPVSSLAATAQGMWRTRGASSTLVCVDARMGEVYWAAFEMRDGLAHLVGAERITSPEEVSAPSPASRSAAGPGDPSAAEPIDRSAAEPEDAGTAAPISRNAAGPGKAGVPGPVSWTAAGSGFEAYGDELAGLLARAAGVFPQARPQAIDLLPLAQADLAAGKGRAPGEASPVYLRSESAWKPPGGSG